MQPQKLTLKQEGLPIFIEKIIKVRVTSERAKGREEIKDEET